MARETRKELLKQDEFMEAAFDLGTWFEENYQLVVRIAIGILVTVLVIAAVLTFQRSKDAGLRDALAEGSSAFTRLLRLSETSLSVRIRTSPASAITCSGVTTLATASGSTAGRLPVSPGARVNPPAL